jgi:peptide chain release factor 3
LRTKYILLDDQQDNQNHGQKFDKRLAHEYGAEVRLTPAPYYGARWVSGDAAELERLIAAYPHLVARDGAGVLAFLAPSQVELELRQERFDKIRFHAQREYSGLEQEAPA